MKPVVFPLDLRVPQASTHSLFPVASPFIQSHHGGGTAGLVSLRMVGSTHSEAQHKSHAKTRHKRELGPRVRQFSPKHTTNRHTPTLGQLRDNPRASSMAGSSWSPGACANMGTLERGPYITPPLPQTQGPPRREEVIQRRHPLVAGAGSQHRRHRCLDLEQRG